MSTLPSTSCVRFEQLIRHKEFTDEEIEFVLDHLDSCPSGHHTPDGHWCAVEALSAAAEREERPPIEDDIVLPPEFPLWQLPLDVATPLSLTPASVLSTHEEIVQEIEVATITAVELKRQLPWIGQFVRVVRSLDRTLGKFVYQVAVDVEINLPADRQRSLQIDLITRNGHRISTKVTSAMPSAVFTGELHSDDLRSMTLVASAGHGDAT